MRSKNAYKIASLVFILLGILLLFISYEHKQENIQATLDAQLNMNELHYNQMYENFKILAQNVNILLVNNERTIAIFKEAYNPNVQIQNEARIKLQNYLQKDYLYLLTIGFRQLHFHLSDNRSFLRMHKPSKFGDDLTDIRYSVKKVNETLKPMEGFEEGRIVNGFRFVYPIFDASNKHLGSVEASVSSKGFIDGIESAYKSDVYFIIKKVAADSKLWKEEVNEHYVDSFISEEYYLEKKDDLKLKNEYKSKEVLQRSSLEIKEKLNKGEKFVVYIGNNKLISFLPVRNIKDNQVVAYFVIHTKNTTIEDTINIFWLSNISIFLILMMILYLLHKEYFHRRYIEQLNIDLAKKVENGVELSRKKDQQMLLNSRLAQMGEMISMIAHQWRQPLAAISATSIDLKVKFDLNTYALEETSATEECKTYFNKSLDEIDTLVQNLTLTIDDFRNFYKPNKESALVEVHEPIIKALNIIRSSFVSQNITLIESYESQEKLDLYLSEVMHVILNILKNSQDNFKEKKIENPKIQIKTYSDAYANIIEIKDNGLGIEPKIMKHIFDPYFSTKNEKNGSGLGLYMSKVIIEEHHNGTIMVKNENGGLCTIITFYKL